LLLTSDGITEATVPSHRGGNGSCSMLNQEGLWEYLQQQPADLDLDHLLAYIHLPEGEQEDDQTILSLEVTSC
jgi:serine phosphatase RsbU (regulator of sigma subunit)